MRVLLVLPDAAIEEERLGQRCKLLLDAGHEVAVCHRLAREQTLQETLDLQRKITRLLRHLLESAAESIPVFVVTGTDGDGIEDCARAWGATDVHR